MNRLTQEVVDGLHDGETFYICSLITSWNPLISHERNIKPTKVRISQNNKLGESTRAYHWESNSVLSSMYYPLYGMNDYNSRHRVVQFEVFKTMSDAKKRYVELLIQSDENFVEFVEFAEERRQVLLTESTRLQGIYDI